MANNKISYELCAAAEAAENGVRRTWSPEQYREYAAKLDRLVEAAKGLIAKMEAIQDSEEYRAVWAAAQHHRGPYRGDKWEDEFAALTATLRDIVLPRESKLSDDGKLPTVDPRSQEIEVCCPGCGRVFTVHK